MIGEYPAAAIDLGSNMIRLALGRRHKPGYPLDFHKEVAVSRIAEGLAGSGRLARAPVERTIVAVRRFHERAIRAGVSLLAAVATGALRQARNGPEVRDRIERATGLSVEVISAEREAELTARGIRTAVGVDRPITVIDVGGASTEIVVDRPPQWTVRSYEIGVITLTERAHSAGGPCPEVMRRLSAECFGDLAATFGSAPALCFASGGAAVALAAHRARAEYLSFAGDDRTPVSRTDLATVFADYDRRDPIERARRIGVSEEHGNLVPAGWAILDVALRRLGLDAVVPSGRGVAEGLLDELLS